MAVQRRGAELADRSAAPHLTNHSSPSCRQPITAHLLQVQRAEVSLLVAAERHDLLVHHQLEVAGVAVAAVLPPPGSQSEVSTVVTCRVSTNHSSPDGPQLAAQHQARVPRRLERVVVHVGGRQTLLHLRELLQNLLFLHIQLLPWYNYIVLCLNQLPMSSPY